MLSVEPTSGFVGNIGIYKNSRYNSLTHRRKGFSTITKFAKDIAHSKCLDSNPVVNCDALLLRKVGRRSWLVQPGSVAPTRS